MSRISPANPPYPESVQKRLDAIVPPGVEPLLLFRTLARDERLLGRFVRGSLLDRGHLSLREREIVILRLCRNFRSEYEWGVHVQYFAAQAGLSAVDQAATLAAGAPADSWSARERLLVRLCDELAASTRVSETLWPELAREFSEEALLELLMLVGFYRTVALLTNTLQLPLEPGAARFPTPAAAPQAQQPVYMQGSCLCRGVAYELRGELGAFNFCHCTSCRKASGSAHAANAPIDRERFQLVRGEELLREFESVPGKLRVFCSRCGSPLYAYLRETPDVLRLRLGSLDTPFDAEPRAHTFVSDKAVWDHIHGDVPQFAGWAPRSVVDQRGTLQPKT